MPHADTHTPLHGPIPEARLPTRHSPTMKLQANCYPGSHFTLMLVLPQLGGGRVLGVPWLSGRPMAHWKALFEGFPT
eukprot:scaffold1202_cov110-Isochrysis_galbana.AAC.1